MKKTKEFLDIIENLEREIRIRVKKMNFPYPIMIHIDKTKNMSKEVSEILTKTSKIIPKSFGSSILYIIGELTDNIEQHSRYSNAYVLLKYNPKKAQTEIGIFDDGLSIPFVFEKNNILFSKDSEAIKMAIEGKTTKKEDITRGYGLRTSMKIVKALKGEMCIISRRGILTIKDSTLNISNFDKGKLKGTLIYAKLKAPTKDLNIYPYLE